MSCGMKTPLANCLHQTSSILKQSLCFAPPRLLLLGFIFYASLNFSCHHSHSHSLSLYPSLFLSRGSALSQSLLQTQLFRLIVFLCLLQPPVLKRFSLLFFYMEWCGGLGTFGNFSKGRFDSSFSNIFITLHAVLCAELSGLTILIISSCLFQLKSVQCFAVNILFFFLGTPPPSPHLGQGCSN